MSQLPLSPQAARPPHIDHGLYRHVATHQLVAIRFDHGEPIGLYGPVNDDPGPLEQLAYDPSAASCLWAKRGLLNDMLTLEEPDAAA